MKFELKGILPAMITPLTADGQINEKALRKLIDFLINGGVHGIFAIGTTGEFYGLTNNQYREVLEISMDQTANRVPVYAGANAIGTRQAVELAQIAESVGVGALSVLTPFFISLNQKEVYNHFETVAKSTSLPVIMYNNAPKTHIQITPATVAKLADIENIVGIKDSTGDFTNTGEYIRLTRGKDFAVMLGRDTLIHAGLCCGAKGAVAACANVAPRLVADIYDKYMAGDIKGSLEAQYQIAPLRVAFNLGSFPTVIKEALELMGIEAGPCMMPTGTMTVDEKSELKRIMIEMKLLQ